MQWEQRADAKHPSPPTLVPEEQWSIAGESSGSRFEACTSGLPAFPFFRTVAGVFKTPWKPLTAYSDELAPDSHGIPRYVRTLADSLQVG